MGALNSRGGQHSSWLFSVVSQTSPPLLSLPLPCYPFYAFIYLFIGQTILNSNMCHLCYGPEKLPSPVLTHSQVGETWFLKEGSGVDRGNLHTVAPWEGAQVNHSPLVRWGGGEQDRGQTLCLAGPNGRRVESDSTGSARKEGRRGWQGAGKY